MQMVSAAYVQAISKDMLASACYMKLNGPSQSSLLHIARIILEQHIKSIQPCDQSDYNFDLLYLLQT